jgi:catechol 2,3-dioxygenase-like lactoylglutathione lyase family enzyme
MFDHVEFAVGDIAKSRAFFTAAFGELGIEEFFYDKGAGSAGFGKGDVTGLLIYRGELGPKRMHICFTAASREEVAAAYEAALRGGGKDNGGPGYRKDYSPGYYAAFVFDPDGNNIEFLYRDPDAK